MDSATANTLSALVYIALALAIGGGMLALSHILPWWLGENRHKGPKLQPYECGAPRFETNQRHFSVKFYLMALMLALFDIESVFLIAFAVNYKDFLAVSREYSFAVLMEMLVFLVVLGFGLYYIIQRGVLEFNESAHTAIPPTTAGPAHAAASSHPAASAHTATPAHPATPAPGATTHA